LSASEWRTSTRHECHTEASNGWVSGIRSHMAGDAVDATRSYAFRHYRPPDITLLQPRPQAGHLAAQLSYIVHPCKSDTCRTPSDSCILHHVVPAPIVDAVRPEHAPLGIAQPVQL
jgi:hypothetical protein